MLHKMCAWVTLLAIWLGMLMDVMVFMKVIVGHRNVEGRMLLEFCLHKELCVSNTWLKRKEKRKVTFRFRKKQDRNGLCANKQRKQRL